MSKNLTINTQNKEYDSDEEEEGSDYSSSPTISEDDIDFGHVHSFHTFEATVEGQASVKKGKKLELLDDSNSYWWLIRNVESSEIGYIPAENIETPLERLARLNKHRNEKIIVLDNKLSSYKKAPLKKRVNLSDSVHVQLEIIISGTDDSASEIIYKTWDENLINHDDLPTVSSDEDEDVFEDVIEEVNREESVLDEKAACSDTIVKDEIPSLVLKVYAGYLHDGSYQSIRVNRDINSIDFLSKIMVKFHTDEVDKKKRAGVEYYLTVKDKKGLEHTMNPEDTPCSIYDTLNNDVTTPMPKLSDQLKLSSSLIRKKEKHEVKFFLNMRIKRTTNEDDLVRIKLSVLAQKKSKPFHSWLMKTKRKSAPESERIDKLVAVRSGITVTDLKLIAFEKFHVPNDEKHLYRLLLNTGEENIPLKDNSVLSDVLQSSNDTKEKQFILQNTTNPHTIPCNSIKNKVHPETKQPIQVTMSVDRATQAILKRVDVALSKHNNKPTPNETQFTMSVSRNEANGIDIHIPHGILRSSRLGQAKIQYSLLADPNDTPIIQKVIPGVSSQKDSACCILTTEEMETLIRYGSHYLDSLENKYTNRLSISTGKGNDLSNLSDLEKEIQRIVTLNSS